MSLYVFKFDDAAAEERRQREDAERRRLKAVYAAHLVTNAGLTTNAADRVIETLFEHRGRDGNLCQCGCHPRLAGEHGDGFDCRCSWSEERLAQHRRELAELWDSPASKAMASRHQEEEREIATWLAWQPGVEAERTCAYAPEVWEGTVDGHSFFFRERHGEWRIELDLMPTGRTVDRVVSVGDDGEPATETVDVREGTRIAEGLDGALGESPVDHLAFIVTRIREHLRGEARQHDGARMYCPLCGRRVG